MNQKQIKHIANKHFGELVIKLNTSLDNIQKGTDNFILNWEVLKHHIL